MVKNSNDKRVRRSKRVIREALLSLMREKPVERITVTELCAEADVNRNTFYAHYDMPEDVLRELEDEQLAHIADHLPTSAARGSVTEPILEHLASDPELFRLLISSTNSPFASRACQLALERVGDVWAQITGPKDRVLSDMLLRYLVYGSLAVVVSWLEGGCTIPPAELSQLLDDFAVHGVGVIGLTRLRT